MNGESMYTALVLAQETPPSEVPTPGNGNGNGGKDNPLGGFGLMVPFLLILVLMYFIMLRPQRKQEKKRQEMLAQMQKNDHVVTIGGIHGVIHSVEDNNVVLKVDERSDVRLRMAKSAIARILTDDDEATG